MSESLLPEVKKYDNLPPQPVVEPDSEEGRILKRFHEIWAEAKQAKVEQKKIMEESYLAFRSILSDFTMSNRPVERWGLAVFVPVTFQVVMGIQAQLNGRPPQYRVGPLNSPKDLEISRAVGELSKAEFRRAKALREFADAVQLSLIFGTAPLRAVYVNDVREVLVADGFAEQLDDAGNVTRKVLKYKKTKKTFYQGWKIVCDHPLTVYMPPVHKSNVEDLPYYIVRELVDVRDEREYYENHEELRYKDNYKWLKAGGDTTDDLAVYWKQDPIYNLDPRYPGSRSDILAPHQAAVDTQKISKEHLLEKFRVYDIAKDLWYVIENDRVIEAHPNPLSSKRLPVVLVRDYKIVNSVWGLGEPQLIRYLQMEANALHTFGLDGTKYATNGVFAVNDLYLKNPGDMSVYPGKIFSLKNLPNMTIDQVIQSFNMPDVKGSVFRMMGINDQLIARTTGAGASIIGGDPVNSGGSATESNNLKAAATTRVYERARVIEQENLVDVIEIQMEFMADFYSEPLVAKISDSRFVKFVPGEENEYGADKKAMDIDDGFEAIIYTSDLQKGHDVVIEGETTLPVSKAERRTEAMQLLKVTAETRRPPTAEEIAANPNITQMYPQGIPVGDAQKVFDRIVLPTFTVVDNPDEFAFKVAPETQDRKRGVGRPEDVLNTDALERATVPPDPGLGGPQPLDQGVNQMERMDAAVAG
jgi:hypothetical protein